MGSALLLINTGSPLQAETWYIKSFLKNFFSDEHVFHSPLLRTFLSKVVLPRRALTLQSHYLSIFKDGHNPQQQSMQELCQALTTPELCCRAAFLYSPPLLRGVLTKCKLQGIDKLIVLPLYPQSSSTTTKSAKDRLSVELAALDYQPELCFIEDYGRTEAYCFAIAASLKTAVPDPAQSTVYFSYHSLPLSYLKDGQDAQYIESCKSCSKRVAELLKLSRWQCVFQSAFGPAAWQGPFLKDVLQSHESSMGQAVVICPGFAVDCLETLYEVDIELRAKLAKAKRPAADFNYVPCLNSSPLQLELISELIKTCL